MTHEVKVCAQCGDILDYWSPSINAPGSYAHAGQVFRNDEDHVPIPIDPEENGFNSHCDFCHDLLNEDQWTAVLKPFLVEGGIHPVTHEPLMLNMSSLWACCPACYEIIRNENWDKLKRRVWRLFEERNPSPDPATRTMRLENMQELYKLIPANYVTIRRPIDNELITNHEFAPDPRKR